MLPKKTFGTDYFVWGENPKLLLTGGMHGDEVQTARILQKYIEQNYHKLPAFIYIPIISKSACKIGTRRNERRIDLNRNFIDGTAEPEVLAVMQIVTGHKFDMAIDFHEDRDRSTSFYLYDNGRHMEPTTWKRINNSLIKNRVKMYDGWDDPEDPDLGHRVKLGYLPISLDKIKESMGFMSGWLIRSGISPEVIDPEIPGKVSVEMKRKIVEVLMEELALLK